MAGLLAVILLAVLTQEVDSQACWDGTSPKTVSSQLASMEDDVEAAMNNDTYLYEISSDVELGFDDDDSSSVVKSGATRHEGKQYTFLRFKDVSVPMGAQVQAAHVAFSVKKHGSCCNEDFDITMKMQKVPDAVPFTSPLEATWTGTSTSSLTYTPPQDVASSDGEYVEGSSPVIRNSPDLTAMVQEVVDLSDWKSGNAMAVLFGGATSTNTAQSREYWAYSRRRSSGPPESWAPKLEISYCLTADSGNSSTGKTGNTSASGSPDTTTTAGKKGSTSSASFACKLGLLASMLSLLSFGV
eukprot:TRINITY_DN2942_c0_g1_i1.p1 TRINITY_DN2942_c0_g1~~TRINITY_DN2942_c0_g1_i1.p1  ORF type:complete len:299 (+),score=58.88 TRINITY_DN2942_c0_g1_i1:152-1048(+)